mmetsp:Transcript_39876/g.84969  ORF Transcript_39876/g.84969 Transcript_39876/m.84969 type:complete len:244 (-) Transcript_39876:768-1499(-)
MAITGLTSDFVNRIAESRRRLVDYVDTNKKEADSLAADVKKVGSDEQRNIDSLIRQLKSLQHERGRAESANGSGNGAVGGIAEQRQKLESKQVELERKVSILQSRNVTEQAELDEVMAEEAAVRKKADEVRAKKEEIEMARGITVEDLTKGLLNYRYTGLSFVKGERGALKFKFTKLDREDQSRQFMFTLSIDENSDYQLSDVNPPLDQRKTDPVLYCLNKDAKNGFNSFAVGMRKLFKESIA